MVGKYSTASQLSDAISEAEEYDFDVLNSADGTVTVPVSRILVWLDTADAAMADSVAVTAECEVDLPYARMWLRRSPDGILQYVCEHSPEHVTVIGTA